MIIRDSSLKEKFDRPLKIQRTIVNMDIKNLTFPN